MRYALALVALVVAACGGGPTAPTPAPSPLPQAALKYRVIDAAGPPWFCDPDFYPIARADERDLAQQRFPELQRDAETFAVIAARLKATPPFDTDEQLAIYREWKTLRALELQATVASVWGFAYLAQRAPGTGERVEGRVQADGRVSVLSRAAAGPPMCPICLARGSRIATPRGEARVEDLRMGDLVWTLDPAGRRIAAPLLAVGHTAVPAWHEVVRLALADGRVALVSPGHPTADGRRVGDLVSGDAYDRGIVVRAERVRYGGGATFDLLPASATRAYWADGILLVSTLR